MLSIRIPGKPEIEYEVFNNKTGEFETLVEPGHKGANVQLEHSLISISKWESKWKKSFLGSKEKTIDETLDYVRCMTLGTPIDPEIYKNLSDENLKAIYDYINDDMTATKFNERNRGSNRPSNKVFTSEQIYSWMIDCEIPWEAEKWHLNRLLTLIRVRRIEMSKDGGRSKMKRKDMLAQNRSLNAARRARMGSKG